ncbi:MAG: DUF2269 domain-containing protein [Pseudomonadota bacterium]
MEFHEILRFFHVLGATVLIGTGSGIAFFMVMAHRTGDPKLIAHTAGIVVIADYLFTASAIIAQPVTGVLLAWELGWDLTEPWISISIGIYLLIGLFWLPVVVLQHRMRTLAMAAVTNGEVLPDLYLRYFRIWFVFGIPAFAAILAILWLMLERPQF